MHRTSILSQQVKKMMTLKVRMIFSALLSLYSINSLATQNTAEIANKANDKAQEMPWKLWRTDDYFKVSYRIDSVKNLIEIKAQAELTSTLAGFLYFIEDLEMTSHWLDNAESAIMISEIATNEHIFKTRFKSIWPFSAREIVVYSRYWQNQDLSIEVSLEDYGDKVAKTDDAIRMQVLSAHWKIIPTQPERISITYQFKVDPKGNIPQWLAKPMALNSIWTTLNNMREQLPKSKFQQQIKTDIQEIQHN